MNLVARVLITGVFAAMSLRCPAESACSEATVRSRVEAMPGNLTLADLLVPSPCARLRGEAEQVSLGAAPSFGSVRALDGNRVGLLIEGLASWGDSDAKEPAEVRIPRRVLVKRAGATKSCAEIAQFLANAAPAQMTAEASRRWQKMKLNCAALPVIPEATPLELTRTVWNQPARRWEFELHCVRGEDCVPFLISVQEKKILRSGGLAAWWPQSNQLATDQPMNASVATSTLTATAGGSRKPLVRPGQTATLRWEQGGIRVVIPVTCLDGGSAGELV